ncbi:hypothetical protein COP2_011110 [Malus domestica]
MNPHYLKLKMMWARIDFCVLLLRWATISFSQMLMLCGSGIHFHSFKRMKIFRLHAIISLAARMIYRTDRMEGLTT